MININEFSWNTNLKLNSNLIYIIVKVWGSYILKHWLIENWFNFLTILIATLSALASGISAWYSLKANNISKDANKKAEKANALSEEANRLSLEANTIAKRSEYSAFYYSINEIQKGISDIDLSFNSDNLSEAIERNGVLIDELEKIIQTKSSIKIPDNHHELFNETLSTLQSIQTEFLKINSNVAPRMILHRYDGNHFYEDVESIKYEISKRISYLMTTYINIKDK